MIMNRLPSKVDEDAEMEFCIEPPLSTEERAMSLGGGVQPESVESGKLLPSFFGVAKKDVYLLDDSISHTLKRQDMCLNERYIRSSSSTTDSWSESHGPSKPVRSDEFETNQFDIALIYSDNDCEMATQFKEYMEENIVLKDENPPKVCTVDHSLSEIQSKFHHADQAIQRSTYMFLYLTPSFCTDTWADMQKEECLMESIRNESKRWSVVPVHTEPRNRTSYQVPFGLSSLKGVDISKVLPMHCGSQSSSSTNEKIVDYFLKSMTAMLNKGLDRRLDRESDEIYELKMKKIKEDYEKAKKKMQQDEMLKSEASKLQDSVTDHQPSVRVPSSDISFHSQVQPSDVVATEHSLNSIEEITRLLQNPESLQLLQRMLSSKSETESLSSLNSDKGEKKSINVSPSVVSKSTTENRTGQQASKPLSHGEPKALENIQNKEKDNHTVQIQKDSTVSVTNLMHATQGNDMAFSLSVASEGTENDDATENDELMHSSGFQDLASESTDLDTHSVDESIAEHSEAYTVSLSSTSSSKEASLTGEQFKTSDPVKFLSLPTKQGHQKQATSSVPKVSKQAKENDCPTEMSNERLDLTVDDKKVESQCEGTSSESYKDDAYQQTMAVAKGTSVPDKICGGNSTVGSEEKETEQRNCLLFSGNGESKQTAVINEENSDDPLVSASVVSKQTAHLNEDVMGPCPEKSVINCSQVTSTKKEFETAQQIPQVVSLPSSVASEIVTVGSAVDMAVEMTVADSTTQTSITTPVNVVHHHHIVYKPLSDQLNATANKPTKIYNIKNAKYVQIGNEPVINAVEQGSSVEEQESFMSACSPRDDTDSDDFSHELQANQNAESEVDDESIAVGADATNSGADMLRSADPEGEEIPMVTSEVSIASSDIPAAKSTDCVTTSVSTPTGHAVKIDSCAKDTETCGMNKESQRESTVLSCQEESNESKPMSSQSTSQAERSTSVMSEIYMDQIQSGQSPTNPVSPMLLSSAYAVLPSSTTPQPAVPCSHLPPSHAGPGIIAPLSGTVPLRGNSRSFERCKFGNLNEDDAVPCCEGYHSENEESQPHAMDPLRRDQMDTPPPRFRNVQGEVKGKVIAKVSPTVIKTKQDDKSETFPKQAFSEQTAVKHADTPCSQERGARAGSQPDLELSLPVKIRLDENQTEPKSVLQSSEGPAQLDSQYVNKEKDKLFSSSPPGVVETSAHETSDFLVIEENACRDIGSVDQMCISDVDTMDMIAARQDSHSGALRSATNDYERSPRQKDGEANGAAVKGNGEDMAEIGHVPVGETRDENVANVSEEPSRDINFRNTSEEQTHDVLHPWSTEANAGTPNTTDVHHSEDALEWQGKKNKKQCVIS